MSLTLFRLIRSGYFPRELPPPFRTEAFARFSTARLNPYPANLKGSSRPEIFNLARTGTLRRPLSIVNPIQFYRLAEYVAANWPAMRTHASGSAFSLSKPSIGNDSRALGRRFGFDALAEKRANLRSRSKVVLRADIARFYPSMYTHSIAWATQGKSWCKVFSNRNAACLGNDLDKLVQRCQDGQTNGIPIGPDTSLLLAEIILAKVDSTPEMARLRGLRYVDDYEFVFDSEGAATEGLAVLQQSLLAYELHLNAAKTAILPLPQNLEDSWVATLRSMPMEPFGKQFRGQLIQYFDKAFTLASQFPSEGVLKYAAGRVANLPVSSSPELIDDLLTQAARVEAGALPIVLEAFLLKLNGLSKRKSSRGELLIKTIQENAPQRHGSEVAWSLWGCIALGVHLPDEIALLIVAMEDSVCALLALHARSLGLFRASADFSGLQVALTTAELSDTRWMLAYEASCKGWLTSTVDHVGADPNFASLRAGKVSFYDVTKTTFPSRTRPGILPAAALHGGWARTGFLGR